MLWDVIGRWAASFIEGFRNPGTSMARKDRVMYAHMTEKQIDDTVEDSFPASDPPANY